MSGHDRRRAERRGRTGEHLAALALQLKGYRILARRVRLPMGEIDLVARRGRLVAFIEVKARTSETDALSAVTETAWRRIHRAADAWAAQHRITGHDRRFDLIAVMPRRWPRHHRDAWRPDFAAAGR